MPSRPQRGSTSFNPLVALSGIPQVSLPDCQTDTAAWLVGSDAITERRFNPARPLEYDFQRGQDDAFFQSMINEDVLQEILNSRRMACVSQHNLSCEAVNLLTEEDFETKWLALGKEGQDQHLFKAYRELEVHDSSDPLGSLNPGKINCPEVSYAAVRREGGKGFLDLLKLFVLDNNDIVPTQPFILVNPRFDEIIGYKTNDKAKNRKVFLEMRRLMRTHHISGFLSRVVMSYLGVKTRSIVYTNEHSKTKETLQKMRPVMKDFLGPSAAREWEKAQAQKRKDMTLFCSACFKPEKKDVQGKMSACSRCMAIGREIRYCNKECQVAHWRTHKAECGKALSLTQALTDVEPVSIPKRPLLTRPDIPPVLPGYRRSPHLVRLIGYLNENPTKDYLIVIPGPYDPRGPEMEGVTLDTLQGAATFMAMRNRVMRGMSSADGVESSLLYVFRVLQRAAGGLPGGEGTLRKELGNEYGDVWHRVWAAEQAGKRYPDPKLVPQEEANQILGYLKEAGRFKNLLQDFVPGKEKSVDVCIQVGPKRDVMAYIELPESLASKDAGPRADLSNMDLAQLLQIASLISGADKNKKA